MLRMVSYPHRPKSGHITCYLIRTYHVLTTVTGIVFATGWQSGYSSRHSHVPSLIPVAPSLACAPRPPDIYCGHHNPARIGSRVSCLLHLHRVSGHLGGNTLCSGPRCGGLQLPILVCVLGGLDGEQRAALWHHLGNML